MLVGSLNTQFIYFGSFRFYLLSPLLFSVIYLSYFYNSGQLQQAHYYYKIHWLQNNLYNLKHIIMEVTHESIPQQQIQQGFQLQKHKRKKKKRVSFSIKNILKSKLAIIFLVLFSLIGIYFVWITVQQTQPPEPPIIQQSSLRFLTQAVNGLETNLPRKYVNIDKLKSYPQLPFCVIMLKQQNQDIYDKLRSSVQKQNYQNYKYLDFSPASNLDSNQNKQQTLKVENTTGRTYYDLKRLISNQCVQRSILFFTKQPISTNALKMQNYYYQKYNTWLLYSLIDEQDLQTEDKNTQIQKLRKKITKSTKTIEIYSMYSKVFDMLDTNDFDRLNIENYKKNFDIGLIMAGLFQLCRFYAYEVRLRQLFQSPSLVNGILSFNTDPNSKQNRLHKRRAYQQLHSLDQNYKRMNMHTLQSRRNQFFKQNKTLTIKYLELFPAFNRNTHDQFQLAMQLQQLIHLPLNHSLNLLQITLMEEKYNTGKFQNELPICININSHNNIQNERYKKVMDSVMMQNYTNYHIAFIDDFSSDQTLNKTIQYLQKMNFPKDRAHFVRNNKQKFATFNIVNAAFNLCSQDSIQVLLDGDDQLIGKQVLKFVNAQYQQHDLWIFYTTWKDDQYVEGLGQQFKPEYLKGFFGGPSRRLVFYFGHLPTFKTSLLRKVPLDNHLGWSGQFLDTLYDTALQYPLFELAGPERVKFSSYLCYLYFKGYGANDDSSIYKARRRDIVQIYISFKPSLQKLETLDQKQDQEVRQTLKKKVDVDFSFI